MSRIEKYQNSIEKFIINKINNFDNNKNIIKCINNNNYFISIFIIIILSIINKKNNNNQYNHSYYISSAMELLLLIKKNNNNIYDSAKITSLINLLILDNYNISSNILSKDKLSKYYNLSYKEINTFILNNNFDYNFQDIYELITKITCYLFGANTNNIFTFITLSKYYSHIIKFYYDMTEYNNINNNNIINNLGIHKSFEYYMYHKKKFIEISIKMNITSNILYDIIDYIDNYFDIFIEKYKNIIL